MRRKRHDISPSDPGRCIKVGGSPFLRLSNIFVRQDFQASYTDYPGSIYLPQLPNVEVPITYSYQLQWTTTATPTTHSVTKQSPPVLQLLSHHITPLPLLTTTWGHGKSKPSLPSLPQSRQSKPLCIKDMTLHNLSQHITHPTSTSMSTECGIRRLSLRTGLRSSLSMDMVDSRQQQQSRPGGKGYMGCEGRRLCWLLLWLLLLPWQLV